MSLQSWLKHPCRAVAFAVCRFIHVLRPTVIITAQPCHWLRGCKPVSCHTSVAPRRCACAVKRAGALVCGARLPAGLIKLQPVMRSVGIPETAPASPPVSMVRVALKQVLLPRQTTARSDHHSADCSVQPCGWHTHSRTNSVRASPSAHALALQPLPLPLPPESRRNTLTTPSPLQWARVASCFASDRDLNRTDLPLATRSQACQLQHQHCAAPRRAGALAPSKARTPWCAVHGCGRPNVMTRVGIPETAPASPPVWWCASRSGKCCCPGRQPLVVTTTPPLCTPLCTRYVQLSGWHSTHSRKESVTASAVSACACAAAVAPLQSWLKHPYRAVAFAICRFCLRPTVIITAQPCHWLRGCKPVSCHTSVAPRRCACAVKRAGALVCGAAEPAGLIKLQPVMRSVGIPENAPASPRCQWCA